MNCPKCHKPIVVLELDNVEIDYCPACKGVWLDSGELELLLGNTHHPQMIPDTKNAEKKIKCPKCARKMAKVRFARPDGILIDSCIEKHGLWFDGGELEELLKNEKHDNRIFGLLQGIFSKEPKKEGE
jgi:Zn-finger nucleic acid-binding protein